MQISSNHVKAIIILVLVGLLSVVLVPVLNDYKDLQREIDISQGRIQILQEELASKTVAIDSLQRGLDSTRQAIVSLQKQKTTIVTKYETKIRSVANLPTDSAIDFLSGRLSKKGNPGK